MKPRQSDLDHLKWLETAGIISFAGKRLLDLGCGSGYLCHKAMGEGAVAAVGVDIEAPEFAPDPSHPWTFEKADLDAPTWHEDFGATRFDLILAFDIVEHLESPYRFLKSCRSLLGNGGQLVLTTPNVMSWERFLKPTSWSGIQDVQHKTLFSRYSLRHILTKSGFGSATLKAPMRSLAFLGGAEPQVGGQILCLASP